MNNTFVIAWRSKSEPRMGQGKRLMTREEAENLASQLNEDYPGFVHAPIDLEAPDAVVEVDFQRETEEREAVLI